MRKVVERCKASLDKWLEKSNFDSLTAVFRFLLDESRPPSQISKRRNFPNKTEESQEEAGTVTASITTPGTRGGLVFPFTESVSPADGPIPQRFLSLPRTVGQGSISVAITLGANTPHHQGFNLLSIVTAIVGSVLLAASIFLFMSLFRLSWPFPDGYRPKRLPAAGLVHYAPNAKRNPYRSAETTGYARRWLSYLA